MPSTLAICRDPDGIWYAQIENVNVGYTFVNGSTSVEGFCNAMRGKAYQEMPQLFVEHPPSELLEQQFFQECDCAEVMVDIVWSGVDSGELIVQAMEEVADAIFLAIG